MYNHRYTVTLEVNDFVLPYDIFIFDNEKLAKDCFRGIAIDELNVLKDLGYIDSLFDFTDTEDRSLSECIDEGRLIFIKDNKYRLIIEILPY